MALEVFLESLKYAEEINNRQIIAIRYDDIASIHLEKRDFAKAKEYYFFSLTVKEQIEDHDGVVLTYDNLTLCYAHNNQIDLAKEYNQKVLVYLNENKEINSDCFRRVECKYLLRKGDIATKEKKLDEAIKLYQRAMDKAKERGFMLDVANALLQMADVYVFKKDFQQANISYKQALEKLRKIGIRKDWYRIYSDLSHICYQQNDYQQSLFYFKLYEQAKDSIFSESAMERIALMQEKYELKKTTN